MLIDLGADQALQLVEILGGQAGIARHGGAGAVDAGGGLDLVERRQRAGAALALGQAQAFLVGLQGLARQGQQLLVGAPGQVGASNAADQAELGAAPGFVGGQVGQQRLVAEATQAAKQVQLVGTDADGGRLLGADHALATGTSPGQILAGALGIGGDLRQQFGALDAVLGAVRFGIEQGHAQVAVVGQCGVQQLTQHRVAEHPLPVAGQRRGGRSASVGRAAWVLLGAGRGGALVVGGQAAAGQYKSKQGQGDSRHGRVSGFRCRPSSGPGRGVR